MLAELNIDSVGLRSYTSTEYFFLNVALAKPCREEAMQWDLAGSRRLRSLFQLCV